MRANMQAKWLIFFLIMGGAITFLNPASLDAQDPDPSVEAKVPQAPAPAQAESASDVQQEAREEARRRDEQIRESIGYGTDSDLVKVMQTLLRDTPRLRSEGNDSISWIEETPYNEAIYQRIQKGYSNSELETEAIGFFMRQKWEGAREYVMEVLERSAAEDNVDTNLLLRALSYLRNLRIQSSEAQVLGLLSHDNPQVLEQSLITLGRIGTAQSGARILKLSEDETGTFTEFSDRETEALRVAAITALGELAYDEGAPYLLRILEDSKTDASEYSNSVWGAAANALGRMQRLEALPLVLEQFRSGGTQQRYQVLLALSTFPAQPEFADVVLQGLQEAYWKTREQAAKTAGELQLQDTIPSLVYKVANDTVVAVRRAAVQSLRQMGTAGTSALSGMLLDPEVGETQRLDVLRTLILAQDQSVVAVLRQLLSDRGSEAKLSRSGIFRVVSSTPWTVLGFVYKEMLADRAQKTRLDALRAIARERISSLQSSVEELSENDRDSVVRSRAKATLTTLNS